MCIYIYTRIDILNNLNYEIEIDSLSNYSKNTRNAAVSSRNLPRNRGPLVLFQSSHHLSYRGTKRCLKRRGRQNLQTLLVRIMNFIILCLYIIILSYTDRCILHCWTAPPKLSWSLAPPYLSIEGWSWFIFLMFPLKWPYLEVNRHFKHQSPP